MEILGKAVFVLIAFVASIVVGGYVFMVLWSWFIAPTFHIQNLSLAQSIGLSVFYFWIRTKGYHPENKDKKSTKLMSEMILTTFLGAAMFLSIGWIVTLFL